MRTKKISLNFYENLFDIADANQFSALQYRDNGAPDLERKRMVAVLKNIVRFELTDRQRDCVELVYFGGMKMAAAADELGITVPTLSKHLKKARLRIQKIMLLSFPRLQKGGGCGVE